MSVLSRWARLGLVVVAMVLAGACGKMIYPEYKPPTDVDVSERAPVGLKYDVDKFKWSYSGDGKRLQLTGTVKNNDQKAHRGVMYALIFDEKGVGVGMGEAKTVPSVLAPGQSGTFTLSSQTSRPKGKDSIQHLRLLTNTQSE